MAKRGERVAPPPRQGDWELRFATSEAASGWEEICTQAPGPARDCYDALSRDPRDRAHSSSRQHQLKGQLATRELKGAGLEQWQYEITGAGRVWYCIDDRRRRVLLTLATTGHPKSTE
ncbi:MAG: hypothetical protein HYY06_30110 [Deltaproteobacteria bacterium]|nr:hypothetical protein [Deltaproteobacteria bacterium]